MSLRRCTCINFVNQTDKAINEFLFHCNHKFFVKYVVSLNDGVIDELYFFAADGNTFSLKKKKKFVIYFFYMEYCYS